MTNNDELERARFEAWWKAEAHDLHHNPHSPWKRFAWDAWLARSKQEEA